MAFHNVEIESKPPPTFSHTPKAHPSTGPATLQDLAIHFATHQPQARNKVLKNLDMLSQSNQESVLTSMFYPAPGFTYKPPPGSKVESLSPVDIVNIGYKASPAEAAWSIAACPLYNIKQTIVIRNKWLICLGDAASCVIDLDHPLNGVIPFMSELYLKAALSMDKTTLLLLAKNGIFSIKVSNLLKTDEKTLRLDFSSCRPLFSYAFNNTIDNFTVSHSSVLISTAEGTFIFKYRDSYLTLIKQFHDRRTPLIIATESKESETQFRGYTTCFSNDKNTVYWQAYAFWIDVIADSEIKFSFSSSSTEYYSDRVGKLYNHTGKEIGHWRNNPNFNQLSVFSDQRHDYAIISDGESAYMLFTKSTSSTNTPANILTI